MTAQPTRHPGSSPRTEGFAYWPEQSWIGNDDVQTIAMTFVATGLVVLLASLGLDCALFAVVVFGARSLDMVASYRLAVDLLPLALSFTALVTLVTGIPVIYAKARLNNEMGRHAAGPSFHSIFRHRFA